MGLDGSLMDYIAVHTIDGRKISEGDKPRGPMVERLQALYQALVARDVARRTKA